MGDPGWRGGRDGFVPSEGDARVRHGPASRPSRIPSRARGLSRAEGLCCMPLGLAVVVIEELLEGVDASVGSDAALLVGHVSGATGSVREVQRLGRTSSFLEVRTPKGHFCY